MIRPNTLNQRRIVKVKTACIQLFLCIYIYAVTDSFIAVFKISVSTLLLALPNIQSISITTTVQLVSPLQSHSFFDPTSPCLSPSLNKSIHSLMHSVTLVRFTLTIVCSVSVVSLSIQRKHTTTSLPTKPLVSYSEILNFSEMLPL